MSVQKVSQKNVDRLRKLAEKAYLAREKFEAELRRCERLEGWSTVCAENNISIHSTPGDWLS